MARFVFVSKVLECLTVKDEHEARRCLYERDLELLRVLLYSSFMSIMAIHGCEGPFTMGVADYSVAWMGFRDCRDREGAIWQLVELLEDLPGVWYVIVEKHNGSYVVRSVPLRELWG